mmetsp:Transcript_24463/g.61921  ORF Transcript_24463/g.61921 Transcript_24463/m.61921 type:complete len:274 (+) Transcript_24463:1079-1900(+)
MHACTCHTSNTYKNINEWERARERRWRDSSNIHTKRKRKRGKEKSESKRELNNECTNNTWVSIYFCTATNTTAGQKVEGEALSRRARSKADLLTRGCNYLPSHSRLVSLRGVCRRPRSLSFGCSRAGLVQILSRVHQLRAWPTGTPIGRPGYAGEGIKRHRCELDRHSHSSLSARISTWVPLCTSWAGCVRILLPSLSSMGVHREQRVHSLPLLSRYLFAIQLAQSLNTTYQCGPIQLFARNRVVVDRQIGKRSEVGKSLQFTYITDTIAREV